MDLLVSAYGGADSDDDDDKPIQQPPQPQKQNHYYANAITPPPLQAAAAACPGRYVSKRERATLAAASSTPPLAPPSATTPEFGSFSPDSGFLRDALGYLKYQKNVSAGGKTTNGLSVYLNGHTSAVNSLEWSRNHAHLLASAGMDHTVRVWNVWNKDHQKACIFKFHNGAVKDVRWSPQGFSLLSCGYDCSSRLIDVEKGMETLMFKEDQIVEVIKYHPNNSSLFLSGGSKGFLRLWDIRVGVAVKEYTKGLGPILDTDFSLDGRHFISSTDTSRSSISENSIIVWDVSRQLPLSNQVYTEAYTCTCIRYHPSDACFVAQSNGNYIAIFSARAPFKLNKYKRYEKHGVWGFPIKCNFSANGLELASGSSDGSIYFYDYSSSQLLRKIEAFSQPCIDVAYHPSVANVVAASSWTGEISVFGS